ncbi:hypothetical protein SLA2020_000500 [Shorea laevis]
MMNVKGKTKDTTNTHFDLKLMGIHLELYTKSKGNNKCSFFFACYTLSPSERKDLCKFVRAIKVPDDYSFNITCYVSENEFNLTGMKCHDCRVFLRLLPLAMRGVLKKESCEPLIELSGLFRKLCDRKILVEDLESLKKPIVVTLCKLEKVFPPSFFNVMIHLQVHLLGEAKVAGPITYRCMYFIERFLRRLKLFVKNTAHTEGSIAEAYTVHEAVTFCSLYMREVETRLNHVGRNYEGMYESTTSELQSFKRIGRPLRGNKY